ncbi:hypothetical protein BCR33DRAFT_806306, partial [Rhizoclosmatium globosum]
MDGCPVKSLPMCSTTSGSLEKRAAAKSERVLYSRVRRVRIKPHLHQPSTPAIYTRFLHQPSTPGFYTRILHQLSTLGLPAIYTRILQQPSTPAIYTRFLHQPSTLGFYTSHLHQPST